MGESRSFAALGLGNIPWSPTACAVGCTLPALRGYGGRFFLTAATTKWFSPTKVSAGRIFFTRLPKQCRRRYRDRRQHPSEKGHRQCGIENRGPGEQANRSRSTRKAARASPAAAAEGEGAGGGIRELRARRLEDVCTAASGSWLDLFLSDLAGEAFELLAVEDGVVDHAKDELLGGASAKAVDDALHGADRNVLAARQRPCR